MHRPSRTIAPTSNHPRAACRQCDKFAKLVREYSGLTANDLANIARSSRGVMRSHLRVLVSTRAVDELTIVGQFRYFPHEARASAADRFLVAFIRRSVSRRLFLVMLEGREATAKEFAVAIGSQSRYVLKQILSLVELGLAERANEHVPRTWRLTDLDGASRILRENPSPPRGQVADGRPASNDKQDY